MKKFFRLEKGVDFFYEMLMYLILMGFPLYELFRHAKDNDKKNDVLSAKLKNLEDDLSSIRNTIEIQSKNITKKITNMKETIENNVKTLDQDKNEMFESLKKNRILFSSFFHENMELINQIKQEKSFFDENILAITLKNFEILNFLQNFKKPGGLDNIE